MWVRKWASWLSFGDHCREGGPTHHRQGERGLETSFEDGPAGNRRKRKSAFLGAGGERQEGGDHGFRVARGPWAALGWSQGP